MKKSICNGRRLMDVLEDCRKQADEYNANLKKKKKNDFSGRERDLAEELLKKKSRDELSR